LILGLHILIGCSLFNIFDLAIMVRQGTIKEEEKQSKEQN